MITENEVVLAIDNIRSMLGELKSMAHNYNELHRSRDRWKKLACERESELNLLKAERDALRDEVNWMHSELHGAEMKRTCRIKNTTDICNSDFYTTAKCSRCKANYTIDFRYLKFCPNCGAKVVEE